MGTTTWIVLAMLVLGGWLVLRIGKYPGNWRFSFSPRPEYRKHRRDLKAAREKLRRLEHAAGQERDSARTAMEAAVSSHGRRVREAELRLSRLRDPGQGALRSELAGTLRLYDHVLQVTAEGRTTSHPLNGISIRDEYSHSFGHVYLTLPDGLQQLLTFSLKKTPEADISPMETPEAEVRAFVVDVHNAIAKAKAAKAQRKALIPQAEADLQLAIADTNGQQQAQQKLEEVTTRLKKDTRIPQARRELDAARDRWQQLTGHRPE
ncbi:hypothetical protein [Streptomyces sp. NRRL B-24484]|uniref:hypothetical protein n=1 Tax=Streptomyces sp. NRRL B-24484 TaxID=1463833 RepID=UPI0004BE5EA0|nr:hypothetical protein [Streptomyces sp. NRRL B-24484]